VSSEQRELLLSASLQILLIPLSSLHRFPENDFFLRSLLHIHVPEGAVEKDGPSAGAAMATALIRSVGPSLC
jgi:ATP-dependent Lon protease